MIKVAMVTEFPLDFKTIKGGIGAVAYCLTKEFNKNENLELHIIVCLKEVSEKITKKFGNTTVHFLPSSKLPYLISTFSLMKWKILKTMRDIKPDIVHLQGQGRYSYPVLNSGYLTILTVHGIAYEEVKFLKKSVLKWIRSYLYKMMEKKCLKNVDYIISVNEYAYQKISHLTKAKHIYLLPNPVDPVFFNLRRDTIQNRIICVGRIEPLKGLECLLEAIYILSKKIELKLHIIGPVERQDYKKSLLRLLNDRKINRFVNFKNCLSLVDLLREYTRCHLLVSPSNQETSPMVIAQGMAAGIPVVATKVGGIPYLIENDKTGRLVDAKSPVSLADGILELLNNPDKCKYLTMNAKEYALRNFRAAQIANKTFDIYKQLVEGVTNK